MWNVKTKVIPVIIGATGRISKSFRKYVSNFFFFFFFSSIDSIALGGSWSVQQFYSICDT